MSNASQSSDEQALAKLCNRVRELADSGDLEDGIRLTVSAIGDYPHAPHPHNLLGILLEKQGNHLAAMKHFRAAWALDPTYVPARQNLDSFGTFYSAGRYAYTQSDCPAEKA